jgi:hypothetical protein
MSPLSSSSRRFIAGLVRVGLIVLAIVLVGGFIARHVPRRAHVRVQTEVPPPEALGPGDMRIYNADSSVDLILVGDRILAGLSPKTVEKIKTGLETSASGDTSGLGASISQIVKKSVAGAIGTHAAFPLSDIRDIRYEGDQIVFEWKDGGTHNIFGGAKVNGGKVSNTFRPEDAQRFVAAVRARMAQR